MRGHPSLVVSLLALVAGCPADPGDTSFQVAQPVAGATFDRCVVRVRTTPPVPDASWGPGGSGIEVKEHVNWRIDGGRETEVLPASVNIEERANFVFGVQLVDGPQTLELGNCDEFDLCTWTPVPVTVANASGAPDCTAPGGGQRLFELVQAFGVTPLADGRTVLQGSIGGSEGLGIAMMKADGTLDTTFGSGGFALAPLFPQFVAPAPDGGFLLLGSGYYMSRVSAMGVLDTAFGNAFNTPGSKVMPCPVAGECVAGAMRSDGQGGFWVAASSTTGGAFVMRLDGNGDLTAYTLIDAVHHPAVAMDATGRALFASDTELLVGSMAGIDTTFGTAGKRAIPSRANAAFTPQLRGAIDGGRVVVTRSMYDGNEPVAEIRVIDGGAEHTLMLAADTTNFANASTSPAAAAIDAQGRVYVTFPRERPAEPTSWFPGRPGTDTIVARIVNGVLDPTFGTDGLSTITYRDVWAPVATEPPHDVPLAIEIGLDGAPRVIGRSISTPESPDPNLVRGPGVSLTWIRP